MNLTNNLKKIFRRDVKFSDSAVVVLSGGQDSTLCLRMALLIHENVRAIHFKYNQRHAVETDFAQALCVAHNVPLEIVDVSFLSRLVTSNMTNLTGDIGSAHPLKPNLPSSFVPVRNALFLTLAHGYAQEHGSRLIYTGVCQTDFSGYPDCRLEFVEQLEAALNTGYESEIGIVTPLMYMTKAQTFKLADDLDVLDVIIERTMTCYNGWTSPHKWGRGCGNCPACGLRKKGYEEFRAGDAGAYCE